MPYTTRLDPASRRAVLAAEGTIDLGGSVEALLALAADPDLGPGWGILVDLTAASYAPNLADATRLGGLQRHAEELAGHRIAFLAPQPALHAMAGIAAALASARGVPAKAFAGAGEADAWLAEASDRPIN